MHATISTTTILTIITTATDTRFQGFTVHTWILPGKEVKILDFVKKGVAIYFGWWVPFFVFFFQRLAWHTLQYLLFHLIFLPVIQIIIFAWKKMMKERVELNAILNLIWKLTQSYISAAMKLSFTNIQ